MRSLNSKLFKCEEKKCPVFFYNAYSLHTVFGDLIGKMFEQIIVFILFFLSFVCIEKMLCSTSIRNDCLNDYGVKGYFDLIFKWIRRK